MTGPANVWLSFSDDPRDPANAALRASDQDRAVVHEVVTEAYADGRLDRDEYDARADSVSAARTLGDLPPLMSDLVANRSPVQRGVTDLATASPDDLRARAVEKYASDRREAILGFLGPSLICWAIWAAVMFGGFPWPVFVMLGTGINLIRTVVRKPDLIEGHVRSLEKKQAKALKPKPSPKPADPGDES